jgi:hypothetical protein
MVPTGNNVPESVSLEACHRVSKQRYTGRKNHDVMLTSVTLLQEFPMMNAPEIMGKPQHLLHSCGTAMCTTDHHITCTCALKVARQPC